jgi:hypothetical protein
MRRISILQPLGRHEGHLVHRRRQLLAIGYMSGYVAPLASYVESRVNIDPSDSRI